MEKTLAVPSLAISPLEQSSLYVEVTGRPHLVLLISKPHQRTSYSVPQFACTFVVLPGFRFVFVVQHVSFAMEQLFR